MKPAAACGRDDRRDARWDGRSRGGSVGNWIFVTIARKIGLRIAYLLLLPVAFYYVIFAAKAVKASRSYLWRVGLGGSWLQRARNSFRHFVQFGKVLLDRVVVIGGDASRFEFALDGTEHIESALREGRGVLIISAHVGGWELAAHVLQRVNVPVNVVASTDEAPQVRAFFDRVFRDRSFSVISLDGTSAPSFAIMAALARGEIVAMHGDRAIGSPTETLPFLGEPARFPRGPHLLAAITGAPVVHTFVAREGEFRYRFRAYPPEKLACLRRDERERIVTDSIRRFIAHLEETIRMYPLQWFNFYDFWQPEGDSRHV